jgi:hypothetical protein
MGRPIKVKKSSHVCDEMCIRIVREKLETAAPAYWNSLRDADQHKWLVNDHEYAFQFVHNTLPVARKAQWAVTRFFKSLLGRKGFARTEGPKKCPTCGK